MKTGDTIQVRRLGTDQWVSVLVDLASENQESLALSAEEGLDGPAGFGFNRVTGRQQLILLKRGERYVDIFNNVLWEVKQ